MQLRVLLIAHGLGMAMNNFPASRLMFIAYAKMIVILTVLTLTNLILLNFNDARALLITTRMIFAMLDPIFQFSLLSLIFVRFVGYIYIYIFFL